MSETYDKLTVLAAANKTAQAMRAERKAKLAEWHSRSILLRFFAGFVAVTPENHGVWKQKIAERISFKVTFCKESTISLSDLEIDIIKEAIE